MKKIAIILTIVLFCMTGCEAKEEKTDAILFKEEYESFNGKKNEKKEPYIKVSIPEDNAIQYSNMTHVLGLLSGGTGVVYLGSPEDQESRKIVPTLLLTANMVGIETIYYCDMKQMGQSNDYQQLLSLFMTQEGNLIYPMVLFIKDGKILKNISAIEEQITGTYELEEKEKKALAELYSTYMHEILGDVCDQNCE